MNIARDIDNPPSAKARHFSGIADGDDRVRSDGDDATRRGGTGSCIHHARAGDEKVDRAPLPRAGRLCHHIPVASRQTIEPAFKNLRIMLPSAEFSGHALVSVSVR